MYCVVVCVLRGVGANGARVLRGVGANGARVRARVVWLSPPLVVGSDRTSFQNIC